MVIKIKMMTMLSTSMTDLMGASSAMHRGHWLPGVSFWAEPLTSGWEKDLRDLNLSLDTSCKGKKIETKNLSPVAGKKIF